MVSRRTALMTAAATATAPITTVVTGCSTAPRHTTGRSLDTVTYLTGFSTFGREGYAWVAQAKGYFKNAGIEVRIQPGAAGDSNLKALVAGQAQFAIVDYSGAVVRAGQGNFGTFRCVAAVHQRTIVALMALTGGTVAGPKDLAGRTIAQATGAVPKLVFPAYAKLAGLDPANVHWQETTPQALPDLLAANKVDAIGQFVVGVPAVEAASGGRKAIVLPYSDYLTDLYGSTLVTTTDLLARRRNLVQRFGYALMQGVRYAVDHPEEAAGILRAAVPTTNTAVAAAELTLMRGYVASAEPGHGLGTFDEAQVARGIATMQSVGLYQNGFDPSQVVDFEAVPSL